MPLPISARATLTIQRIAAVACLTSLTGAISGCGPKVMSKGSGASGKLIAVAEKPDLGLEIINKLDGRGLLVFNAMHLPFAKAAMVSPGLVEQDAQIVSRIQKESDQIEFMNVKANKLVSHFVIEITTNQGLVLPIMIAPQAAPNHSRTFVAIARNKLFDGLELRLDSGRVVFGPPTKSVAFTLNRPKAQRFPSQPGTIVAIPLKDRTDVGGAFGIVVDPVTVKAGDWTILGSISDKSPEKVIESIRKLILEKPGQVRIKEVHVKEITQELFGPGGPQLPQFISEEDFPVPEPAGKSGPTK